MNAIWIVIIVVVAIIACTTAGCLIAKAIEGVKNPKTPVFELKPEDLDEIKPVSASEEKEEQFQPKEGEYTGILHISNNRYKFERPVMCVMYRNKPVYFTYNERGEKVNLSNNPKLIADIKAMLKDHTHKSKLVKWYPIDGE